MVRTRATPTNGTASAVAAGGTGGRRAPSLVDRVVEWLTERIVDGTMRPLEPLNEAAIVAELGVSRTPVREALVRLRHEGLVSTVAGRPVVADLSEREVREIYLVRSALSGVMARLVGERARAEDFAVLRRHADGMSEAARTSNLPAFFTSNVEFHRRQSLIADNATIGQLIASLGLRVLRLRYLSMGLPGRMEESSRLHQELVDAWEQRDLARAEQISRAIIDGACDAILYFHFGVRARRDLEALRGEIPLLVAELRP